MAEPDAFDPTHALDGWRPPARAPVQELDLDKLLHPRPNEAKPLLAHAGAAGFDPTHLLDGWRPPAPAPLDLELKSMLRAGPVPDEAKMARLKARGYEMLDVEDVEDVELVEAAPAPQRLVEAWGQEIPPAAPFAEATLAPPSSSEDAMPAEEAVDLPLPREEVWPLFMEEAQVLDVEAAPTGGIEIPVTEPPAKPQASLEPDAEVAPEFEAPVAVAEMEPPAFGVEEAVSELEAPPPSFIDDIHLPSVPPPPAVVEAPVLDFRAAPPPPEPDLASVIAGIELPKVAPPPVFGEMPELDIAALTPQPLEPDPRLLARWQAGAWTALARQIAGASEALLQTPDGLRLESRAPQWLCAIWPPQAQEAPLGRWPELASLVAAATMSDALQQLLAELPDEAPLWSADLEADWDLIAELVLHQDTGLKASEARTLHELAEAERKARQLRLGEGYALQGRVARRRA